ncbi:BMP family ABC transporter substrate-binding protein [Brevibacillus daliensis]|uniref:BMP family ABC transporter substrate-binding protein n=1 Tax=Brevibacillus daliensis TaxID=2892995 RepID=UPI001E4F8EF4|nr:BMP family ABC transporter substrate-binding protein [Brevibacillus daliensis]
MAKKPKSIIYIMGALVIWLLLILTFQFLVSMNQIQQYSRTTSTSPKIALLLEGPTYDQAWNSTALQSMYQLQDKYKFELEIVKEIDKNKIEKVASNLAAAKFDLVIGHGIIFSSPFDAIAPSYPDTRFVTLNGEVNHPNQTVIKFDMEPAGYVIGKLSTLMTKTNKVGFIVTNMPNDMPLLAGLKRGVAESSPKTTAIIKIIPDYNDQEAAIHASKELIAENVDVIYSAGDSINLTVITVAQKHDILSIGYISDQRFIAPNHVITSLMQDVNQVYTNLIDQFLFDQLPNGIVNYGLREGVNHLGPYGPMVSDEVKLEMTKTIDQLTRTSTP